MQSFLDCLGQVVSDDTLERRLRNSSEDGPSLHPPIGLFEAEGRGPLGRPYSDL